ncbi:uridine 5'-monophosphate synthase-like [Belonocnema kinseyi]|uniref:uridine 5'-monophosphate synthase-like n=1 Tax=Belonocnema kinseyi TaxID=2817044 RepID=UPI00143D01AB|nr:uridine 5'-monophosphate synthase-like [Belonocnema kinseyi]XP_033214946.1 uridine 5'-monophosphate synthase-like [Belonocnema kinseyi]XP_033214947.1 uridine 5'-monophosphate synthase-like [Belonocnema kinseyi]XP_033214948.1 uridine 5'-monophosphate synthase-like [Belonocnema kinseyi]
MCGKLNEMEAELKELAVALFDIGAVKFTEVTLQNGWKTPIYMDLRVTISYPKILRKLSQTLWKLAKDSKNIAHICGVPYTALPFATVISVEANMPMLIKRKEAKSYGTKKLIEGNFESGDKCVIIEDVIVLGSSALETINDLRNSGLKVTEVFVVVDREQGGRENLQNENVEVRSLFTISQLMKYLLDAEKITLEVMEEIMGYISKNKAH